MEFYSSEDCPGFSPDSLFIRFDVSIIRNQFGAKVMDLLKILFHFPNISNGFRVFISEGRGLSDQGDCF